MLEEHRLEPLIDPGTAGPARGVVVRTRRLSKSYATVGAGPARETVGFSTTPESSELVLFRDLDLTVHAGEMVAIVGASGSGKSSLLHLLAALDRPTTGEVWVRDGGGAEINLAGLTARSAAEFRNRAIGYVWQFHYLLPEFTALENVAMPLLARGTRRAAALVQARRWLAEVGLDARAGHRSGELSGGEQQRVSLARALVTEPRLLLADEPTGDLDPRTAEAVFALIQRMHREHRLTSVLVTHSAEFARRCGRMLTLADGGLQEREGTQFSSGSGVSTEANSLRE